METVEATSGTSGVIGFAFSILPASSSERSGVRQQHQIELEPIRFAILRTISPALTIATCPNGKESRQATPRNTWRGTPNFNFAFSKEDCLPCELRERRSRAKNSGRTLTIYPQREYDALAKARERQATEIFKEAYDQRAGIEGTHSQGVRRLGLRKSRYLGLEKTRLQHMANATAINLIRVYNWLTGERPVHAAPSPFLKLAAAL